MKVKTAVIFRRGLRILYYENYNESSQPKHGYSIGNITTSSGGLQILENPDTQDPEINKNNFVISINYGENITRTFINDDNQEQVVRVLEIKFLNIPETDDAVTLKIPVYDNKYRGNSANSDFPPVEFEKIYTFSKAKAGSGGRGIEIVSDSQTIEYDQLGNIKSLILIILLLVLSILIFWYWQNILLEYYRYIGDNWQKILNTSGDKGDKKITFEKDQSNSLLKIPGTYSDSDLPIRIKCLAYDGPTPSNLGQDSVAEDRYTIFGLKDGSDSITVVMSQEFSNVTVDINGDFDFSTTENEISVFQGSTQLQYVTEDLTHNTFKVALSPSPGIAVGYYVDSNGNQVITEYTVAYEIVGWDENIGNEAHVDFQITAMNHAGETTVITRRQTPNRVIQSDLKGERGSGPIFRGVWSHETAYTGAVGDNLNVDVVSYGDSHYIALKNSGPFGVADNNDPATTEGLNWKDIGAQFSSVATQLLVTQESIVKDVITLGQQSDNKAYIQTHNDFFIAGIVDGKNKFKLGNLDADDIIINYADINDATINRPTISNASSITTTSNSITLSENGTMYANLHSMMLLLNL